jgi:hypothetical protein
MGMKRYPTLAFPLGQSQAPAEMPENTYRMSLDSHFVQVIKSEFRKNHMIFQY